MSWIVRIGSYDDKRSEVESILDSELASLAWDLGTTGLADVEGDLLAGFDDHEQAVEAVEALTRLANQQSSSRVTVALETATDVATTPPVTVGPVLISWDGDVIELSLESNAVFGHGGHPTTRLALDLVMGYLSDQRSSLPGGARISILDVGTGTGVLAIAASRTGLATVTAIDIDPLARSTASRNAAGNGVDVAVVDASPTRLANDGHRYDMVLANVLLAEHRNLAKPIVGTLGPAVPQDQDHDRDKDRAGGFVILSGYLSEQSAEVLDLYRLDGVNTTVLAARYRGEWAGHLLRIQPATSEL